MFRTFNGPADLAAKAFLAGTGLAFAVVGAAVTGTALYLDVRTPRDFAAAVGPRARAIGSSIETRLRGPSEVMRSRTKELGDGVSASLEHNFPSAVSRARTWQEEKARAADGSGRDERLRTLRGRVRAMVKDEERAYATAQADAAAGGNGNGGGFGGGGDGDAIRASARRAEERVAAEDAARLAASEDPAVAAELDGPAPRPGFETRLDARVDAARAWLGLPPKQRRRGAA